MKLVENAGQIAKRSHSMWAGYLGLLCLLVPEVLFLLFERDTNPRLWWWLGIGLIAYGLFGRLKDQGIDRTKLRSSSIGMFLIVALPLIGGWEGKRNHAYLDIVGVPTICYGHTKGVALGDYMTDAQCAALLRSEVLEYREGLHGYFSTETKAKRLPAARDAAYVSLAYNVGIRGAGRSTATRRLNAGDVAGGCQALTWWNKAGGRVVRGLVRRRADEYQLCMMGVT
ncbi:lysozyme [Pseudophaeobacter sp.]|jgi:GH24 family phage-related lysozyme (muramidase)|uniref:lysozyme n=1 Tax=Pseudophaeobacter sp. TaxID=1971739 RepID=UPI0032D9A312